MVLSGVPERLLRRLGLKERMGSIFAKEKIMVARLGPALGVHGGQGILFVAIREKLKHN